MSKEKVNIKLIKRKGRKSYEIRIYRGVRELGYQFINTHESNQRDAKQIFNTYRDSLIKYQLGLANTPIPKKIPLLKDAVNLYLQKKKSNPDIAKKTYSLHKLVLNKFVEIFGEITTIESFSVEESDRYDIYLKTAKMKSGGRKGEIGYSEAGQNMRKRVVTTFFNWCINDRKWIDKTDFHLKQSNPPEKIKLITPFQFKTILKNEPDEYKRSYYRLAWFCGLRRKEINSSELITDPNLGLCLYITESKGRNNKDRIVPIPENNIADWNNVKEVQFSNGTITHAFRISCIKSGLYKPYETTFHTLRHSYATIKCAEGVHLMELAQFLGHTSTKVTEKYASAKPGYYAMLRKEQQSEQYIN
jgi:integrase